MQGYIGYIRVSTVKQGTKGVSLLEQRDAIFRYSERNKLPIAIWFEEMETAAKRGRPVFNQAITLLRHGKARGIILHKLDRGARNLKDWADIGELVDHGIEVHFVNESLDLQSRGGRLSADIQAVVAADFIRNLREETRKGFYGRLKQGLYPLRAPLGYLDQGKGKPKLPDPAVAPMVRKAFELYGSARYTLETLGAELHRLGLRNHHNGRVTRNGLSTMLNNPFYMGIIRIRRTNETFPAVHEPLIRKAQFDRVQAVLTGKINTCTQRHNFIFRRLLSCATCHYSLIAERQKGHVYYRCHSKQCSGTSIREDQVETEVKLLLQMLKFNGKEMDYFGERILKLRINWTHQRDEATRNLSLRYGQVKDRLSRLTDAFLDQALDKTMFEERKASLLLEQRTIADGLADLKAKGRPQPDRIQKFLELASNAWLSHQMALPEEKREIVKILTSNRIVGGKKLDLEPSLPFLELVKRSKNHDCDPQQDTPRTLGLIFDHLSALNDLGQLPDLSTIPGFQKKHSNEGIKVKE